MKDYSNYTISELANVIWKDWNNKMYFGAVPYWEAMTTMTSIDDAYGLDSGRSIVMYFLGNANTWRGEVAREVKKELNKRLK